ncbi:MAG: glycerol-3-phosphate acyltransferase, partial [Desulfobacula sp.]|nr:glycerol-3-phosphate acyltransferase [Desulfobacula sp.]
MTLFQKLKNFILQIRIKIRCAIKYMLGNTYDYFLCFYPGNSGFFTKKLIRRLVNKLNFDDHNIKKINDIDKENIIVYASKHKRTLDFLYYHTKLKSLDLPYPQIGFDFRFFFLLPVKRVFQFFLCHIDYFLHNFKFKDAYSTNYVTKELINGKSGFISLIEEEDFYKRFIKASPDPLFVIIELQKNIKKPIIIIPENIIYITKPMRNDPGITDLLFGTHEKPGRIKRLLTILRYPDKIKVEFASPINLKNFIKRPEVEQLDSEFQAHRLRRYLVDILNRQIKSVTGPVLKSRQEITEDILTKKALREYLADYASQNSLTLKKTHKKAAVYIKEIAANYNLKIINIASWVLTWAFKNLFDELIVNQDEINRMREISTKAPLVLVPCHKSHLDYLLLPYVMFHNNMPCPHIAAGKNLSFWPLGPLFRRAGAFFIRRTFKGAPLYSKIFSSYLEKLLSEGFNIKIFIEGGRSRTGKLLAPRPGGLGMLINAYNSGACPDLYFVPIFIGYDRVLEEDAYLKEIEGGKKNPETLKSLISARKFLKKKYGKVYMRFNEPISIKQYIQAK